MPGKAKYLGVQSGHMGLAVSDGELNSSGARGSSHSVHSLPGAQNAGYTEQLPVASWAESFETLLQDRVAVTYFTEFLKKEFSAENVYFWQACERFQQIPARNTQQLAQEAWGIYDEFLSSHAVSPVNIDRQAWIGEEMLATPTPDMFRVQQLQIFNLMKFDSYARFVKSPLFQACVRAENEGQPLPNLRTHSRNSSPPPDLGKKAKLKLGKSLPLGVEVAGSCAGRSPQRSFRRGERREPSWTEVEDGNGGSSLWRESQGSLNSSTSLDLGFLSSSCSSSSMASSSRAEVSALPRGLLRSHGAHRVTPPLPLQSHRKSLGGTEPDPQARPSKYCCVYLPDGTASLASVRAGVSIRDMLAGLCEKRGFSLPDIKVYLVGNEQKALVLDQDSMVLMDQEVKLENRVSFELEISPLSKTVRITAKSTKCLREALQPVLGKYGVDVERALLRRQGEPGALDLEKLVGTVAAQKLILEAATEVKATGASDTVVAASPLRCKEGAPTGTEVEADMLSEVPPSFTRSRPAALRGMNRCTYDLEGLVELLNRAQSCRANDQRGLLSKEVLVLPDFLQLPGQDAGPSESSERQHGPCDASPTPKGAGAPCPLDPALAQPPVHSELH
ncbi:Sjoegren syndrome nuclear autoantigen 1-like protein [Platysternon megacephalum]|uniref:Regulator of G-protein signaling 14 n=1 Tax=Platysternon megacephalum TaxID=55544 RepID=A0A4D9DSL1_9SAUR|nr:Sjoegren syndrome nuclear autoantigen 1-like protein [Platysternon megacephalum]